MAHKLVFARLNYGSSQYPVEPTSTTPLPVVFDFDNPEESARHIFAVMSNASGGHTLRNCKVRFHRERGSANLTSSGCHVFFHDDDAPKMSLDAVMKFEQEATILHLGDVTTDQYGDGWKRAVWTPSKDQEQE